MKKMLPIMLIQQKHGYGYYYSEKLEKDDDDSFRKIEKILADFVLIIGKSINWTLSAALGRTLTLEDIVFNR